MCHPWTPKPFRAPDGTVPFERFVDGLPDFKLAALDAAIESILSARGIDLVRTEWLKALGKGLHEFRVRHDADEIARMFVGRPRGAPAPRGRVLLRVFVHFHGQRQILLLGGYDKGDDPTQRRQRLELAAARRHLASFRGHHT